MTKNLWILILWIPFSSLYSQEKTDANIFGDVRSGGEHLPFVSVFIEGSQIGTTTDITGHYMLINLPEGSHTLVARLIGYETARQTVEVRANQTIEVNFSLEEKAMHLNEVVITGTKTFKRSTESPVIVNVLDRKTLDNVQACNISEGLRFQPGLRVEIDCQTCNYTQLRMNGLGGAYSQILINGRPVLSPLTGLYGMEMLPASMVEQIEVVRGGGSALHGASAIGGTVNIITRIPLTNNYEIGSSFHTINGKASDHSLSGNANVLNAQRNAGVAVFLNHRNREAYDHNGDGFSEMPSLRNNAFGANFFFKPDADRKLELSISSLSEYRYGGEIARTATHLAAQAEERTHHILIGNLDYHHNFNNDHSSVIFYLAGQSTRRDHYTGLFPDDADDILNHLADPPYGFTDNSTLQAGGQFNHRLENMPGISNVLTLGAEYTVDDILDTIAAYHYIVDQRIGSLGGFFQSDWMLRQDLNLLTGIRMDKHPLVQNIIVSPRLSLLYRWKDFTQFRLSWGTGFRAPQAFDADLHMAFAGGGVSRILLAESLKEERSNSFSASINFDKATADYVAGFTLEGFYTRLSDAFYLYPFGEDAFGDLFEKRNGSGAVVQGATLELRANFKRKIQLETGFTLQSSLFDDPIAHLDGQAPIRRFLRSPDDYGYFTFNYSPDTRLSASLSAVYTGSMEMVHYAGAPEQAEDAYVRTDAFTELSLKIAYTFELTSVQTGLEIFGGITNITNAYQGDFDTGKYRDSDYIYGPGAPRTFYAGLKLKQL
jgi:outer membrane receptor for ferrienterochelin and colicins